MKDRILIVDDEEDVANYLFTILIQEGFQCETTHSASEALTVLRKNEDKSFSLIMTDIVMPIMGGIELIEHIQKFYPEIGVLAVSADKDVDQAVDAMRKGALDFIMKPFQPELMMPRIQKALERVHLLKENREYQKFLEEKVETRTAELIKKHRSLQKLYINTVEVIARAIEAKDSDTQGHSKRVSKYCVHIARKMGVEHEDLQNIEIAGLLHDVGKIGIADEILGKPTKLTIEEYEAIKEHPLISLKILEPIDELKQVKEYVKHHHERWDGRGYPGGLKENEIPLGARILSVADAFDTMWIGRQYHAAWNLEKVIKEFENNRNSQFDPKVVDTFIELIREVPDLFSQIRKENPPVREREPVNGNGNNKHLRPE